MNLIEEVYNSLKAELEITDGERFNPTLLHSKVDNAYREVKTARRYPASYTEAYIDRDMEKCFSGVLPIAKRG